ncbi:MAG: cardiolipin synthase B, partial [Lysobacteraceae bacterium]
HPVEQHVHLDAGPRAFGQAFADALAERARAGVKVHVLLDWVGSAKMDDSLLDEMRASGVQIRKFHKPHWYTLGKLNNRTHRKLLVVDGRIGFTGGVGIAPTWTGAAQDADHWRDTHYRIEGPVVAQMQATFLDNWMKVEGEVLHGQAYFPKLEAAGDSAAQMFSSSPTSGSENMQLMYHMAIAAADRSIDLSMAYFVPDDMSLELLADALRRGVKLRIVTPGPITDSETVRSASKAQWGDLLKAGAEIYEYQPTMYHCKVMVVDGLLSSVGSTNFDPRSFRLNDEANLNVYDAAFAARQQADFEDDLRHARRYTLQDWESRPLTQRAKEALSSLLRSQ